MKKVLSTIIICLVLSQPCFAWGINPQKFEHKAIEKLLKSQVKYANKNNFDKFIKTYDHKYINGDGFNLDIYSKLVKDIWNTYDNIKYGIEIKSISVDKNRAQVELVETSFAEIALSKAYEGELKSKANTIYHLEKINGDWKVVSDNVLDETTTMLYGDATGLDIKLSAPTKITPSTDYIATLEFTPPEKTVAIASLASDIVEYPQKPTKEVFRPLPEDNILERFFTSNKQNANEYVVASIGLTRTEINDLSLKLNLTGFGYAIRRVNVISNKKEDINEQNK